jgi:ABC-type sugar transport system ATPase subunit
VTGDAEPRRRAFCRALHGRPARCHEEESRVRGVTGGCQAGCRSWLHEKLGKPEIIFLNEPTTGLDPRSRRTMWTIVRELVGSANPQSREDPDGRAPGPWCRGPGANRVPYL